MTPQQDASVIDLTLYGVTMHDLWESNLWAVCGYVAVVAVAVALYRWNSSTLMINGGWVGEGRETPRKRVARDDMPPPYPNGWFKLMRACELKKKEVKSVTFCGKKLVAFRTDKGEVGVLDAYCSHLGADLGVHGVVRGDCVECPFHAWRFNSEGTCTGVGGHPDVVPPKGSAIQSYETMEANDLIYIHHDAELRDPSWRPPVYTEIAKGEWYLGAWSGHEVLTHCAEIPENGADVAHLGVLHEEIIFQPKLYPKGKDEKESFFKHLWECSWEPNKEEGMKHSTIIKLTMDIGLGKWCPQLMRVPLEAHQVGPGLVFLHMETAFGKILMMECVTPVGQLRQRCEHFYWAENRVPAIICKLVGWGATRQFTRDIDIWESKTFVKRPILTSLDGPIGRFRTWYKQFYSENSLPFGAQDDLSW